MTAASGESPDGCSSTSTSLVDAARVPIFPHIISGPLCATITLLPPLLAHPLLVPFACAADSISALPAARSEGGKPGEAHLPALPTDR